MKYFDAHFPVMWEFLFLDFISEIIFWFKLYDYGI